MSYVHLQLQLQLQLTGPPAFPNGGRGHTNSQTVAKFDSGKDKFNIGICFQNCSALLQYIVRKNVLVIEKTFEIQG